MGKKSIVAIIIGIVMILGLVVWSMLNPPRPAIGNVRPPVALAAGTHLYDVRTPEEYSAGHAEFATNWPLTDIESDKYPDLAKDAMIAVYCRSGNRSAQAKSLLEKAGFTNVKDIGGLDKLNQYGLKIIN